MSWRKSVFLICFLIVPALVWTLGIQPEWKRRKGFLNEQRNAEQTRASNRMKINQSAELQAAWQEFGSLAEEALQDLGDHLNPALIQKRIVLYGRQHECDIRVQEEGQDDDQGVVWYSMKGIGEYKNLVQFVDALERGDFRIRFQQLRLTAPVAEDAGEEGVVLNAVLMIPRVPEQQPQMAEEEQA